MKEVELKQGNEAPFEFYKKKYSHLNLQRAQIQIQSKTESEIRTLSLCVQKLALRVLLKSLRNPILD